MIVSFRNWKIFVSMTESKTFKSDVFIYFPYDIDKKLEGRALSSPIIGKKDRPGILQFCEILLK